MKITTKIAAVVGVMCLALPVGAQTSYTAYIDPSVRYQTWDGWGTSLCWWANVIGDYKESAARQSLRSRLIRMAYGPTGLNLNIARYNIGGGANASDVQNMEFRARMPGFKAGSNAPYDWTQDAGQQYVLQQARSLGADRFEAFSNSPPYWMTVSGSVRGAPGGADNLRPESINDFARYLTDVVEHFRQSAGITFETIAPMNEPHGYWWDSNTNFKQEGCVVTGGRQSDLVDAVAARLTSLNSPTRISAADENETQGGRTYWDEMRGTSKNNVLRLNVHTYGSGELGRMNNGAVRDRKRLWMSEYGDGDPSGVTLAQRIIGDLRELKPSAWVYWQVIDGGYGWGCVDLDLNSRATNYTINRKYYLFGQFTRFIRPGMMFIPTSDENSVAALSANGKSLTIVTVNPDQGTRRVTHDLTRFALSRLSRASVWISDQNARNWQQSDVMVQNQRLIWNMPPRSVTTFVVPVSYGGPVFSGWYQLRNARIGNVLDVPGGSWNWGQRLTTYTPNGGYNQQFRIEGVGDGRYKFCARDSGLYLSVDFTHFGNPVIQWGGGDDDWRTWNLIPLDDGSYRIEIARTRQAMDANPTPGNGYADVVAYDWWGGANQRWFVDFKDTLYP